jgi:peroxiredoxin
VPAARGLRVNIKPRAATRRRKEYATHVHAVVFRAIGETFAALPSVQTVVCSGYSQRIDAATGRSRDDYLLSVRVRRPDRERIDFTNLAGIDLAVCLAAFELRRTMSATGIFRPIEPFA